MLLAQIKANYSSGDDISSDDETQDDPSESEGDEVKRDNRDDGTSEYGKDLASETSDSSSDEKSNTRHHLLRHKLILDEGASGGKTASESEVGMQEGERRARRKRQTSDTESTVHSSDSNELVGMSEELSQSEEDEEKLFSLPKIQNESIDLKKQVQCIWLSDSSSGKEDEENSEGKGTPKGRKKIRKIIEDVNLRAETQEALREEEERRKRLANRDQQMEDRRVIIEIEDELSQVVCPVTTKLVLDQDKETRNPLVQVHPNLVKKLKPHQVDGVQFIWDSCCESVKKANSSPGSGSILAHCMGLGKTLQVVTFLHTVLLSPNLKFRTALVVCPLNTILNWISEFKKWQKDMGQDRVKVTELATVKRPLERLGALQRWQRDGGVMIMGYDMYRILSRHKISNEEFKRVLVDPGPDFVVCDEGHILRNENSNISRIMNVIKTQRRVVLTGTPLQNKLDEYHCMVNFIKKNLLGSLSEFRNRFINPILNGRCADSTPRDVKIMKNRAHVLHSVLAGCVQRRDYSELTQFLPPKYEYVLAVRVSPLQYRLYSHYIQLVTRQDSTSNKAKLRTGANLFKDFQVLSRIWTHPWGLQLSHLSSENKGKVTKKNRFKNTTPLRSMGTIMAKSGGTSSAVTGTSSCFPVGEGATASNSQSPQGPDERWFKHLISQSDAEILEHSGKMVVLFKILQMAENLGDKVLVFSQSLVTLNLIEKFLEASHRRRARTSSKEGSWIKNLDYYRFDGSTSPPLRKKWTDSFNHSANVRARLFLISTRAGSLGINLVAANRVVIFDASWNPSYDIQSIYRVYRFGQLKQVYVYRLLAQGTMEEKIYDRQVTKESLSYRVVDHQQIERHFTLVELTELYSFEPDMLDDPNSRKSKRPTSVLPKDGILAKLLDICKDQIVSYHEHESLLDHKQEEELSEAERKAAWAEYEAESNPANPEANATVDTLQQKTNEQLVELLNRSRTNVAMAFQTLQKMRPHTLEEYMVKVHQEHPQLSQVEVRMKAEHWKQCEEKKHDIDRAFYRDALNQQQTLTFQLQAILTTRGRAMVMTPVNQPGPT